MQEPVYEAWKEIYSDYDKAKKALWCPKHAKSWQREEEKGRYYMWSAYHKACEAEPKDYLLYARILAMMADETRIAVSDYARYNKYIKPAAESYKMAEEAGQHPTEKELEDIRFSEESIGYVLEQKRKPYEDHIRNIIGHEKLKDFEFHDSKPIWFEHTEDTAKLRLQYDDVTITLLFEGVIDFQANGDPTTNWIMDFYCFPCWHNKKLLTFDVDYYTVTCSSVSVEDIEEAGDSSLSK